MWQKDVNSLEEIETWWKENRQSVISPQKDVNSLEEIETEDSDFEHIKESLAERCEFSGRD